MWMRVVINSIQFSLRDFFLLESFFLSLSRRHCTSLRMITLIRKTPCTTRYNGNHFTGATVVQENGACIWSQRKTSTCTTSRHIFFLQIMHPLFVTIILVYIGAYVQELSSNLLYLWGPLIWSVLKHRLYTVY